ncbi:MAG: hypothetical protein Q9163_000848 [Psora crenata]
MRPKSRGQTMVHVPPSDISSRPSHHARQDMSSWKRRSRRSVSPGVETNGSSDDTLAQLSYGPATKTTVVTTTTTTTTKFPPLLLKAPKHLHDLDPKQYPLAASQTPESIRKLCFEIEGRPAIFEEADDTLQTIDKLKKQKEALTQSHGTLRSVTSIEPAVGYYETLNPSTTTQDICPSVFTPESGRKSGIKRSASPISISEAATLAGQGGPRKRRYVSDTGEEPIHIAREASHSNLQHFHSPAPITPQVESNIASQNQQNSEWDSEIPKQYNLGTYELTSSSRTILNPGIEDDAQVLSPKSEMGRSNQDELELDIQRHSFPDSDMSAGWPSFGIGPAITPRVEDEPQVEVQHIDQPERPTRPRLQALNTATNNDASLPSPSLSPVTAAANLQARRSYFEQSIAESPYRRDGTQITTHGPQRDFNTSIAMLEQAPAASPPTSKNIAKYEGALTNEEPTDRSLMSIPYVVSNFEAMPEEMKKYVMYQLLRRCSKPVLHFIADAVNPALKCDFIKHLPTELSEAILGHLDVKSLCSAAQVSKRWRHQVDLSEKIWKRLFYGDGYTLQEGELARAIREGWGWQTASRPSDAEQDLSLLLRAPSDKNPTSSTVSQYLTNNQTTRSRRSRKVKARVPARTLRKRKQARSFESLDEGALLSMTSATDGPYAAASAAAAAISLPRNDLHLWKSIYLRHHLIRQTWMREEVAPRHIAFRAHQRHVVTCLQFDSEKILTGSDDANINVYDTETGALRAKLEGHEGGVWALQYEGNILVSGSTDRSVRVWDIEKGICTQILQGHTSTVRCLQILMPTPTGQALDGRTVMMPKQPLIITGSRDSQLRVWKLPKPGDPIFRQTASAQDDVGECPYFVRALVGHHHSVRAIAAHADTLVSGSYDCTVRVWKISTGETVHRLQGHTQKVYSVVLDQKRNRCISGSMDNVVKVWSLDTGMALFNLEGHSSLVGLLDLQQDRLVSAAADSTLRIWDPENGHCRSTLSAHTGAITCFQHDGQKVISGSDRTLKMWKVAGGEFVRDLLTDLSGVWQVKFNERRCVAAVQPDADSLKVLDFGACRDGVAEHKRGRRILVDGEGREILDYEEQNPELEGHGILDQHGVNLMGDD